MSSRPRSRKHRLLARGRRVLLAAVLGLAALQIGSALLVDHWRPELADPEYRIRRERLRAAQAENPERPLVLMLGSSRVLNGFRPERLHRLTDAAGAPITSFNFGLLCAGPLRQHCGLRHLLADGIRPDLLLLEIMPPLYNQPGKGRFCDENWLYIPPLPLSDAAELLPHFARPHRLVLPWLTSRLMPGHEHQRRVFQQLAGNCLPAPALVTENEKADPWGWSPSPTATVTAEEQRRHIEAAHRQYHNAFPDFRLGNQPCRLLDEMLESCRRERVAVCLIRMPESAVFRGWYTASLEADLEALTRHANQRFGAPTINARQWVPDSEFWDGHHLLPSGAALFSERLARDVVLPWFLGQPGR